MEIENIIGDKNKQTPGKRYQVQMFLQNLLEYDSDDFILIGERMLSSENIRYYVKYVFYEILGQIQKPDDNILRFIVDNCENELYGDYLLNNVVFSRKQYITVLRKQHILERIPQNRQENQRRKHFPTHFKARSDRDLINHSATPPTNAEKP